MSGFKPSLPVILSIAGSDCSAGAGIQADLKTAMALGCYCATVVTCVTAQSSDGVSGVLPAGRDMIIAQLRDVLLDFTPSAVKIGLLPDADSVRAVVETIRDYGLKNVIVDPVLSATAGGSINNSRDVAKAIIDELIPLATLVTPSKSEVIPIFGEEILNFTNIDGAHLEKESDSADSLYVLLKGGDFEGTRCVDRLPSTNRPKRPHTPSYRLVASYESERIDTEHTHGTGCVLSSAIACFLAKGESVPDSVAMAKRFVGEALLKGKAHPVREHYGPLGLF